MLRYTLFFILFFQVFFFQLSAQVTVQLGTGTNETSYDTELTPFGSYYHDQRNQYILLASELTGLGLQSGYISSIAFDVTSSSSQALNNFKIKLKHTSNSDYSSTQDFESMSTSTLCYSGTYYAASNQWNTINFSSGFYWNGSSNIVIEITFDNSSFTADSEVMYSSTSGEMTWGMASDSEFSDVENMWEYGSGWYARPNIKISGAGTAPTYFETWNTTAAGDDINWTIRSGATPSGSTGPSSAYDGADYVYVEASSPNYPSKKAYLTSPLFNLSSYGSAEINFAYHMYGSGMGSLSLEASTNGSTWTSLWSKSGDQGNQWHQGSVSLDSYAGGSVYLRFTGITGSSYASDMALDQLVVSGGAALSGNASPSSTQNYVHTIIPQDKDATDLVESISYFDGLGRAKQNVSYSASPNSRDII